MAVTTYAITNTEVFATIAHEDSTVADPTSTTMTAYILRFSAEVNVALESAGLVPASIASTSNLYELLRGKIIERCASHWLARNQDDLEAQESVRPEWDAFLSGLRSAPGSYASDQTPTSGVVALIQSDATRDVFETTSTGRRLHRANEWN